MFQKHFNLENPIFMYKVLNETKDKKIVNWWIYLIEDLEKEVKKISKEKIEIEKPCNIVKVVKKILDSITMVKKEEV